MPFGAFRLNTLSQAITGGVTPPDPGGSRTAPEVTWTASGDAQIDSTNWYFDGSSSANPNRASVTVSTFGNAQITSAQSKFGGSSVVFDGSGDYFTADDALNGFTSSGMPITIECWVRPTSTSSGTFVFALNGESDGSNVILVGSSYVYVNENYNAYSTACPTYTWSHLAFTSDGTNHAIYVNGNSVYTWNTSYGAFNTCKLAFGAEFDSANGGNAGNYFNGWVDEVRVSDIQRYNSSFTPESTAFTNDSDTTLLLHLDSDFSDDNGGDNPGASVTFDGTGDYLTADTAVIPTDDDFTIEFWVKPNATETRYDMVTTTGQGNGRLICNTSTTGSQWQFFVGHTSGNILLTSTSTYEANTWYHYAAVRNGGDWYLFIDGDLEASTTGASRTIENTNTVIGRRSNQSTMYLNGNMDEFLISDTAKYTTSFTPDSTPFTADANTLTLLHFDTDFSDDMGDTGGGETPPEETRTAKVLTANGDAQVSTAQYKFGTGSFYSDGTTDYISTPDDADFDFAGSDWCIEAWVRPDPNITNGEAIVGKWSGATGYAWLFTYGPSGTDQSKNLRFGYNGGNFFNSTTDPLTDNAWNHIVAERSGTTITLYANGNSVATHTIGTTSIVDNTTDVTIGAISGGNYSPLGYIDEVRISNTTRYNGSYTTPTTAFTNDTNTVLLVHMDGANGDTTFTDDTGGAGDGAGGGTVETTLDYASVYDYAAYGNIEYAGTNSSGEPVFLTMGNNTTNTEGYYQFFSVANDGTITKGTNTRILSSYTTVQSMRFATEKSDKGAGSFDDANQADAGICYFYDGSHPYRVFAFTYDLDAMTMTVGSDIELGGTDGSNSVWDVVYVDNQQFVIFDRGANNDSYMVATLVERSGTTVSTVTEDVTIGATGGMGNTRAIGFAGGGWSVTARLNNADGGGIGINKVYNDTFYRATGTGSQWALEIGDGSEGNCNSPGICKLNNTGKYIAAIGNTAGGEIGSIAKAVDADFKTGTSSLPTYSNSSVLSLDSDSRTMRPVWAGNDDTCRVYVLKDGNWQYKTVTDTGSLTLSTDSDWTDTGITPSISGSFTMAGWNDGTNNYYIISYRNSSNEWVVTCDVE